METEHSITSVEAQWLRIPMTLTDEGLDYEEITLSDAQEGMVHGSEDDWEYECSCGESFKSQDDAEEHLKEQRELGFLSVPDPVEVPSYQTEEEFEPATLDDGYVFVIVNRLNPEKRDYCEDDETAAIAMDALEGEIFELRIIGVDN